MTPYRILKVSSMKSLCLFLQINQAEHGCVDDASSCTWLGLAPSKEGCQSHRISGTTSKLSACTAARVKMLLFQTLQLLHLFPIHCHSMYAKHRWTYTKSHEFQHNDMCPGKSSPPAAVPIWHSEMPVCVGPLQWLSNSTPLNTLLAIQHNQCS